MACVFSTALASSIKSMLSFSSASRTSGCEDFDASHAQNCPLCRRQVGVPSSREHDGHASASQNFIVVPTLTHEA